eukprot:3499795-Prymnesium_polylepis.1
MGRMRNTNCELHYPVLFTFEFCLRACAVDELSREAGRESILSHGHGRALASLLAPRTREPRGG